MAEVDTVMIRQGELVGRGIMAYETTEEVGIVEHLLVDMKSSQVVALSYKTPGLLARRQALSWAQLVNIGRDRIIVHTQAADEATAVSSLAAAQKMTGLEVWTDGGDHIGHVVDLCLNIETGDVQKYLFARHPNQPDNHQPDNSPLNDSQSNYHADETAAPTAPIAAPVTVFEIAPQAIISTGRKRMMIAEEEAQQAQPYHQPLEIHTAPSQSDRHIEWSADQLPDMPKDLKELLHQGQSLAGKVTQQVKQRAKQFTDEQLAHQDFVDADSLPDITEQLQAKTEQVKQQMQQQLKKATDKVRENAQDQLDSPLGKQVSDRIEKTPFGRSLGQTLNRFKRPQPPKTLDPIDVEAFEVWEDDD